MPRVTAAEVKEIIVTTLSDPAIEVFITPANLLVTAKLGASELSDELLKEIERWLSAHFLSVFLQSDKTNGGALTRDKVGDTEREWRNSQRTQIDSLGTTNYGKQAIILDTTGTLVSLGKRKSKVEIIRATLE